MKRIFLTLAIFAALGCTAFNSSAADAAPPKPTTEDRLTDLEAYVTNGARQTNAATALATSSGPGHNAWQMTSTALVLFMTLPGLALFYGGWSGAKTCSPFWLSASASPDWVTILWVVCGYSITFHSGKPWWGSLDWSFLKGVDSSPNTDTAPGFLTTSSRLYQLMFAIITPALIVGAIAERMKFSAILVFVTLWMFVVYFPLAHMVWGVDGYMNGVWNAAAK